MHESPYSFPLIALCLPSRNKLIVREVGWVCLLYWVPPVSLERLPHDSGQFLRDFGVLWGGILHLYDLSCLLANSAEGPTLIIIIRAIFDESTYENSSTPATWVLPASSCSNQLQQDISTYVPLTAFSGK